MVCSALAAKPLPYDSERTGRVRWLAMSARRPRPGNSPRCVVEREHGPAVAAREPQELRVWIHGGGVPDHADIGTPESSEYAKQRCLKTAPFHTADEALDGTLLIAARRAHISTPTPRSTTRANVAFHVATSRPLPPFSMIVFGRSKTARSGSPPKATKSRARQRTIVSVCSSSASVTATKSGRSTVAT